MLRPNPDAHANYFVERLGNPGCASVVKTLCLKREPDKSSRSWFRGGIDSHTVIYDSPFRFAVMNCPLVALW